MAGLDHVALRRATEDDPQTASRNARYGLVLFFIYLLLYTGYMLLNAFRPADMDVVVLAGINLATAYGAGLIGGALLLALAYGWLCRTPAGSARAGGSPPREDRA